MAIHNTEVRVSLLTEQSVCRNPWLVYASAFFISLSFFSHGYMTAIFGNLKQEYVRYFAWKDKDQTWYISMTGSCYELGAIIIPFFAKNIIDGLGRYKSIVIANMVMSLCFICTISGNYPLLIIGRLMYGIVGGVQLPCAPLYIREITPISMTGITGSFVGMMLTGGLFFGFLMGFLLPFSLNDDTTFERMDSEYIWRIQGGIPLVVNFIQLAGLLLLVKFDTPRWYHNYAHDNEKAVVALRRIYTDESVENELKNIVLDAKTSAWRFGYTQMFKYPYYKALLLGLLIGATPQVVGISAFNLYSREIYIASGLSETEAIRFAVIASFINFLSATFLIYGTKKLNRKVLWVFGTMSLSVIILVVAILIAVGYNGPTRFILLTYFIVYSGCVGSLFYVIATDILPAAGMNIAVFFSHLCGYGVSVSFNFVKDFWKPLPFFIYGGFAIFSCILSAKFLPETKNKNFGEINQDVNGDDAPEIEESELERELQAEGLDESTLRRNSVGTGHEWNAPSQKTIVN